MMVDLVIPVYNEAHVLQRSVRQLAETMRNHRQFDWRIVIVNNGSTDNTEAVGRRLASDMAEVRFLHLNAKGRGRALRKAWNETDALLSIYMDVDLSTDLSAVPRMVNMLLEGADIVSGSRAHRESQTTRCLKREILSRLYNRLIRWLLHTRTFDDAQCGFKGIRVDRVRLLLPLVENEEWFFDTELLVLAENAGLRVETIPIHWVEDPDSRVDLLPTICEDLRGLFRLRRTVGASLDAWHRHQG